MDHRGYEMALQEKDARIDSLRQQLSECEKECLEEARLNGMGSEREAKLMAALAECERERDAYHTQLNNIYGCDTCNGFPNLTDPRVSDAAFRAVFHDVTELKDWKSRETVELELAAVTKELEKANKYADHLGMSLRDVKRERDELHQICRDAYEVWAGSEGIPEPVYASEAYLYQLLINMRDEVKRGLAKVGADKTGEGS